MKRIYFDISATTPLDKQVANFVHELQQNIYGNPSSIHREGQSARALIEKARRQLASVLNSKPDEIIFTSSGTEANNMALKGVLKPGDHCITSTYEHPAILQIIPFLEKQGVEFSLIKPDNDGIVKIEYVIPKIRKNTRLISIMHVNNELGTINPIKEIAEFSHKEGILFHSDAVQALGKISVDVNEIPADFLSMSSHKLYGPKGTGALFKRNGINLNPLIHGGGQEANLRASTENITGIAGFGFAAELSNINMEKNTAHIQEMESHFLICLDRLGIIYTINGKKRVPGVFNITFHGLDAQNLVMQMDMNGIGISFGAACASGTAKASHMLLDMGLNKDEALSTVRISFGKIHSKRDIETVTSAIGNIIALSNKKETVNA